jgi:hypothetical protein
MVVIMTIPLSVSILLEYLRPGSVTPNVTHATIPLDFPDAEPPPFSLQAWPIVDRLFSSVIALITTLLIGLSLRRPAGRPVRHDAWYQATMCLYFAALVKLLLDVDFGLFITVHWWIGFLPVSWHHLVRSRAIARTMRKYFLY